MIGTLEQLFDYERIEDAWKAILGDQHTVYLEFCDDDKDASQEPYIEVQLNNVVPTGELYPYRAASGNPELIPFWWKGTLISRVVTFRGVNSDRHRDMVGAVRLAIQRYRTSFTEAISPFHRVAMMQESSLSRGVDERHDWSEVHAEVTFYVRDGSWPE